MKLVRMNKLPAQNIKHHRWIHASIFYIMFIIYMCVFAACENKNEPLIVAKYDDIDITLSDFERSYFNAWQTTHLQDSPELRQKHAEQMILMEIAARNAMAKPEFDETELNIRLKKNKERYMRRRLLETQVKKNVERTNEAEINEAMRRKNKRYRIRQLYAKNRNDIEKLQQQLNEGKRFEVLARHTLPDEKLARRAGDMGWIGWGDTDLNVEDVIYTLKTGEVSEPVQSLMGWHIFKIDSEQTILDFKQSDIPFVRQQVADEVFNRKLDIAAAHYIRDQVWSKELAMDTRLFKPIWDHVSPLLPTTPQERLTFDPKVIFENVPESLPDKVLATVDGEPFLAREFLDAISDLPRYVWHPNLKKAVEIAIRDKILTQQAIAKGFAEDPVVLEKLHRDKISTLYYLELSRVDSLENHTVDLKHYYKQNKNKYIDYIETEIEEILVDNEKTAIELAKRIHDGADFRELAASFSLREETRMNGGYLGFVSNDTEIGKKAATLAMGAIFAPVKTTEGFSVIRIGEKRVHFLEYDSILTQLAHDAQYQYYDMLKENLIPDYFDRTNIVFFKENLSKALTEQSKTIF